jgi:hypothetical protein
MLDNKGPYIVAAFIPCTNCNYPCVITTRFEEYPSNEALDRHVFQATCENCGQIQTRVGADAFQRTVVEWGLEIRSPRPEEILKTKPDAKTD